MADSNPIIIGGGINAGTPFTLGNLVYVSNINPAQLTTLPAQHRLDGSVQITAFANNLGAYPAVTGATETVRIQGGLIVLGAGTDTVQIGRAATAAANQSIVIGATAADGNQVGVVIGFGAAQTNSAGIVIGPGANIGGNAGGSTGIAIGTNASAVNSGSGGGDSLAIGTSAIAKQQDVVIGGSASSNIQNLLGNSNVVIGFAAAVNVGQGAGVAIGSSSAVAAKAGVAVGQAATIGTGINNVAIGQAAKITGAVTGVVVVGQGSVASSAGVIMLGSGAVDLGTGVCQLGAPNTNVTTIVIGQGDTFATPNARVIRFTNASGLNSVAGGLTLIAPLSTGNSTPGGITFQTGVAIGSGSTLQTAATAMQLDGTTTATNTRLLLYTVDTGTVQRVQTITNAAILTLLGLGAGRLLYVPA
jgi:hypothetical protein